MKTQIYLFKTSRESGQQAQYRLPLDIVGVKLYPKKWQ